MKVEENKELQVIINDVIEEAVSDKIKVGKNDTMVKYLMKKFIRKNKLSENSIKEAWFMLETECRSAGVWKDTRNKSALKDGVSIAVRNFISTLEGVTENKLTLEDGTSVIVDVIFKKGHTLAQEKTRKEMTA